MLLHADRLVQLVCIDPLCYNYTGNFIGAYVRGKTREEALQKFSAEIEQYCHWIGLYLEKSQCSVAIIQKKRSDLQICDADSDVIFDSEIGPLTIEEYKNLRSLALKSAMDFETLYRSVPIKNKSIVSPRKTFYGMVPITADEMYIHTKNVNNYYFGEIHVPAKNEPDIYTCRLHAFEKLEEQTGY